MNKIILVIITILFVLNCSEKSPEQQFFQTFPDHHTVALWLFDETEYNYSTLSDAGTGHYDLRLMPEGHLSQGKFGNALDFSGQEGHAISYCGFAGKTVNNHIRKPDGEISGLWGPTEGPENLLNALASDNWSFEFWFKLDDFKENVTIIDLGQGYDPGFSLTLGISGNFELINSYSGIKAIANVEPANFTGENWHHLAFTQSDSNIHCFVNGRENANIQVSQIDKQPIPDLKKPEDREHEHRDFFPLAYEQRRLRRFNITLGHQRPGGKIMKGMIDEVRFSNVTRYEVNFELPASFARKFGAYGRNVSEPAQPTGPQLLFDEKNSETPLDFGMRKHVFIDEAIIDSAVGVSLQMNRPNDKAKINFVPEKSAWRPTVVDIGGKVYLYVPEGYSAEKGRTFLYTSDDGLHFTEHDASPVIDQTPLYGTFFEDTNPHVPDEERFKLTSWIGNRGIFMFFSPDGIKWRRNETTMLSIVSGGGAESFYDDQKGNYVTFIRRDASFSTETCPGGYRAGVMFETKEPLKTWSFERLAQPYYEGWTLPAVTCEGPSVFAESSSGQSYRTRAIKYPWADDVYLAFVWRYPSNLGDDPARHVDLGVSRDGINWTFFEPSQGWYIPTDSDPDPEQISIYGLIRRGDNIWQYTDHGGPHGGDAPRTYYRWTQRLDGFVSLDGSGFIITKPLVFNERDAKLYLNSTGSVKTAILNSDYSEMSEYDIDSCDPIADDVDHVVSWNGKSDLSDLAGKPVRLKFEISNSKLFAFELKNE